MAIPTYFTPQLDNGDWLKKRACSCDRPVFRTNRSNTCRHYYQPPASLASPLPLLFSSDRSVNEMFNQITKINDHLYLSGLQAITPERLRMHGITLVVTAMMDPLPDRLAAAVLSTLHVNVEDVETSNLLIHFDSVSDRISREARRGGKVVVHCMAGISRSSSLVMAYLVKHKKISLLDAFNHVKALRPIISPNLGFWRQLISYEEMKRGSRSMKITTDETSRLNIPYQPQRVLKPTYSSLNRISYPPCQNLGRGVNAGRYTSTSYAPRQYWSNGLSDYLPY